MQDSYLDELKNSQHASEAEEFIAMAYPDIVDGYFEHRLIDIRAYMMVCMDNQHDSDDLFAVKLKHYEKLFNETLEQARKQIKASSGLSVFSVSLERG